MASLAPAQDFEMFIVLSSWDYKAAFEEDAATFRFYCGWGSCAEGLGLSDFKHWLYRHLGAGGVLFVAGMGETRASDMAHRIVLKYYWIRGLLGLNVAGIVVTRNLVGPSFISG